MWVPMVKEKMCVGVEEKGKRTPQVENIKGKKGVQKI